MISENLYKKYYDHSRYDGTLIFYDWIRQNMQPDFRILNLGAGPATGSAKRILKGSVREVVGADIDPIVLENDELDAAVVIEDGRLPLDAAGFDLVYTDFVLEHVEKPAQFLQEARRVLKPGGRLFFRTPNLYHYVSVMSALTPHGVHKLVANRARGLVEGAHEPWQTFYRMNSRRILKALTREAGFCEVEFRMIEAEPSYLMFHPAPFMVGVAYERLVNATEHLSFLRSTILGKLTT